MENAHDQTASQVAKARAMAQFGAHAADYIASKSHQSGDDLPRLVELAVRSRDDRALDIATGGGNVAKALAPHVREVVASDLTQAMLDALQKSLAITDFTNITVHLADAEELPFAEASFDIVTCRIAPHHFPNPERFARESARVLRPGGRFVMIDTTVPDGANGEAHNRVELMRDPSHVRSLTQREWTDVIEGAGLDLRAVEDFPKRHVFADWMDRAGVPADRVAEITSAIRDAGDAYARAFNVEWSATNIEAFTDVKTLFFAVKPGE